jgi:hypothetical protein
MKNILNRKNACRYEGVSTGKLDSLSTSFPPGTEKRGAVGAQACLLIP